MVVCCTILKSLLVALKRESGRGPKRAFGATSILVIVITRILNRRCYTPRLETALAPLPAAGAVGTVGRFHREVSMENTLTPPVFYLLIAWGIVTAVFIILLIRRGLLSSHEDDQIFLDAAKEHMARQQRELVAKIGTLSRPLLITGILSGALLLLAGGLWIYEGLRQNF